MEEKEIKAEERKDQTKLTWETPKLYALDKGETEGGLITGITEDTGTMS